MVSARRRRALPGDTDAPPPGAGSTSAGWLPLARAEAGSERGGGVRSQGILTRLR
ncbi:MAG: hypothetical protein KatS3mg056_0535 [Chloroflexus sp.]|jgi:hypothetical protein|nr:MAG: hypothetical protein KatS3mg056_0535 [Chloroflexus sp.]